MDFLDDLGSSAKRFFVFFVLFLRTTPLTGIFYQNKLIRSPFVFYGIIKRLNMHFKQHKGE